MKYKIIVGVILIFIMLGGNFITAWAKVPSPFVEGYYPYKNLISSTVHYVRPIPVTHFITPIRTIYEYRPVYRPHTVYYERDIRPIYINANQPPLYIKHHGFWYKLGRIFTEPVKDAHPTLLRGLLAGVGTAGALYIINTNPTLAKHPFAKTTLKGVAIGAGIGIGIATKATLEGAIIGGVAGAGTAAVQKVINP